MGACLMSEVRCIYIYIYIYIYNFDLVGYIHAFSGPET
jgi:hypothetical protein